MNTRARKVGTILSVAGVLALSVGLAAAYGLGPWPDPYDLQPGIREIRPAMIVLDDGMPDPRKPPSYSDLIGPIIPLGPTSGDKTPNGGVSSGKSFKNNYRGGAGSRIIPLDSSLGGTLLSPTGGGGEAGPVTRESDVRDLIRRLY